MLAIALVSLALGLLVLYLLVRYTHLGAFFTGDREQQRGRNSSKCYPPGWLDPPADSLHGDLKDALSTGSLQEFLAKRHKGGQCPVAAFWWMGHRVVSVSSASGFKATEHLHYRPGVVFGTFFSPLHGTTSLQDVNGKEWKERRSLLQGAVRGDNLLLFYDRFVKIATDTAEKWSNVCHPQGTGYVNLRNEMFRLLVKGILNTCFTLNDNDNYVDNIARLYDQCKSEMDQRILDVPLPDSRREMDFQSRLKRLKSELQQMKVDYTAKEHCRTDPELPLLRTLLNSHLPEEVIDSDMVTFLGGFHTASYFAMWTLLYLAHHSEIQDKLVAEREKILSGVDDPEERKSKLKTYCLSASTYLRQHLDETLRMSSTVGFSGHYSEEDMVVDGYHIPAETPVLQAIGVAMKSESVWESPHTFDPDRFKPGTPHGKRGPEFRPFGVSCTRRCPANLLVYLMMSVYVSTLMEKFTFHLAENTSDGDGDGTKYGIATSPREDIAIGITLC